MFSRRKRTFKDFFYGYCIISSSYASVGLVKTLIKQYNKYLDSKQLFSKIGNNNIMNINKYYLLAGEAKKLISPIKNTFNQDLIGLKGNTVYFENFILNCNNLKYIIQPTPLTKFFSLKKCYIRNENNNLPEVNKLFISKSEVLNNGDKIYLFGKAIENKGNLIENYENLIQIKPYIISHSSYDELKKICLSIYPMVKTCIKISFVGIFLLIGIKHFYLKYQYWKNRNKRRYVLKCNVCKNNLCDILCEKCENLTNYCSQCYSKLQDEINSKKIKLKNIKCVHCNQILDIVQIIKFN